MPGQKVEREIGGSRVDEMHGGVAHPVALAGSAFVLGLVTGLFVKGAAKQAYERARNGSWHREYERTITYDDNLPDPLARREPAPHPGQPRYGGTGAIGVSPASVVSGRPDATRDRADDKP